MDMSKYFKYESSFIPSEEVMKLDERILDDLYATSSTTEKCNIFFHLQNEYYYLLNGKDYKNAAHICYLISYYLFTALTPPHSETLAREYALTAIKLDDLPMYREWLSEVEMGN